MEIQAQYVQFLLHGTVYNTANHNVTFIRSSHEYSIMSIKNVERFNSRQEVIF
jgi:hypothetical protein